MNTRRTASGQLWRTFAAPLVIALASAIGLVAALVGDGFADLLSWIGLGVPVAAVIWAMLRRRR
jgi:hypothetical protein